MMRKVPTLIVALIMVASIGTAGERNLGPESDQPPTENHEGELGNGARFLINDGSFEFGECDAGSAWTCTTNTDCTWIVDPMDSWGYPAYDGVLVAWLGGFCGPNYPNSNSFCQDIYFEGGCGGGHLYTWQWMGYVADNEGNMMYVTIDGNVVFEKEMLISDHTYGTWNELWFDYPYWNGGYHNLCFEFVATTGANPLVDYISQHWSPTAIEQSSISTVKAYH